MLLVRRFMSLTSHSNLPLKISVSSEVLIAVATRAKTLTVANNNNNDWNSTASFLVSYDDVLH